MAMYRYDQEKNHDGAAMLLLEKNPMSAAMVLTKYALDYPENKNNLPEDLSLDIIADWIEDLKDKDYDQLILAMMNGVKKLAGAMKRTGILNELQEVTMAVTGQNGEQIVSKSESSVGTN